MKQTHVAGCFLLLAVFGLVGFQAPPQPVVRRIWSEAPHNAFTDLIRFRNSWFCCFRESTGHVGGAGKIRILTSGDGREWTSAGVLAQADTDLRDPHLSITPEGRLMLNGGAAVPATRNPLKDHYSFVCFSEDGRSWTSPQKVLTSWEWLWRVTWHQGIAYGVAYRWDPRTQKPTREYQASLYRSRDGSQYEKVTDFNLINPTEAALAFEGNVMYCLQRRDGKPNTAQLGRSEPPYTHWHFTDLGQYLGGPQLLKLPNGGWITAGRIIAEGKATTVLCRLDLQLSILQPWLTLPTSGDCSYPGLVWHDGRLWVSYYSSHEGKSNIYLAEVRP